jgi:hypothetical protein
MISVQFTKIEKSIERKNILTKYHLFIPEGLNIPIIGKMRRIANTQDRDNVAMYADADTIDRGMSKIK